MNILRKLFLIITIVTLTTQSTVSFKQLAVTPDELDQITAQFKSLVNLVEVKGSRNHQKTVSQDIVDRLLSLNNQDQIKALLASWLRTATQKKALVHVYKTALTLIAHDLANAKNVSAIARGELGGTRWAVEGMPRLIDWFKSEIRKLAQKNRRLRFSPALSSSEKHSQVRYE